MRLTTKGRYAVRAMIDLATYSQGKPVRLHEISERQKISLHYLEQLFRKLVIANVIMAVRGPGGGYVLSRCSSEISLKQVLNAVGENINPANDILGIPSSGIEIEYNEQGNATNDTVDTKEFHSTKKCFDDLGKIMENYLNTTTLKSLI